MASKYDEILVERLKEYCDFPLLWNEAEIEETEIADALNNGLESEEIPYDIAIASQDITKEWHIRRILYFVRNPEKIQPILVDNEVWDGYTYAIPKIIDGNHRYAACLILKQKKVKCSYGGI